MIDHPATLVTSVVCSNGFLFLARLLLTFVFWSDALLQLRDFRGTSAAMERLRLRPGWAFNWATMFFKLVASFMIVFERDSWLASFALSAFVLMTIPIAHAFWAKTGEQAFHARNFAMEHVSLIGGLMLAAALAHGS